MQVSVEELSSVKKVLHIEVPEKKVTRKLDQAYDKLKKEANIKGFRPGKAPRTVLERYYKKDVDKDVSSQLIQDAFSDALRETELKVLGTPRIDEPPALEAKKPYRFTVTVEVAPELGEIDFKGLKLQKPIYTQGESELETQLQALQQKMARYEPIPESRSAAQGDYLLVDYEGFFNGQPYAPTQKTEDQMIKIGENPIHPDLDSGLIGMNPGEEKTVSVTFGSDQPHPGLAGRTIDFWIHLKEIRQEVLPAIDDDMAKQFGKENLADLKTAIQGELKSQYEKRSEQEVQEQAYTALLEKTDFEVPQSLIDAQLDAIIDEVKQSFSYHNTSMEQLGLDTNALREKYHDLAIKQVRRYLILNRIIDQENLKAEQEDIDAELQNVSQSMGQPIEPIKAYYRENAEQLEHLKQLILEKKAIDLIIKHSDIEEVEYEAEQNTEPDSQTSEAKPES